MGFGGGPAFARYLLQNPERVPNLPQWASAGDPPSPDPTYLTRQRHAVTGFRAVSLWSGRSVRKARMSEDALLSQEKVAPTYKNPFLWVPTSYFTMGLVYVTVGSVANIMFLNLGMSNHQAALWSSLLGFPYTFKFIWAPLLELYRTK